MKLGVPATQTSSRLLDVATSNKRDEIRDAGVLRLVAGGGAQAFDGLACHACDELEVFVDMENHEILGLGERRDQQVGDRRCSVLPQAGEDALYFDRGVQMRASRIPAASGIKGVGHVPDEYVGHDGHRQS